MMVYRLDGWTFDRQAHELKRGAEVVRLESRAAALLALLCERRGAIVSQREILDLVWGGRHVSANSVPVVIADLRRALGDDARKPVFIETVNKGGYRLIASGAEPVPASTRPRWLVAAGAAAVAAIAIAAAFPFSHGPATTIAVSDVANATGSPRYDALATATSGEMLGSLAAHPELHLVRGGSAATSATLALRARLALWSGKPELVVEAVEAGTGKLAWATTIFVPEPRLPGAIRDAIGDLDETVRLHEKQGSQEWPQTRPRLRT